jgi:molybdopterin synthase catalytic subunit
METTIHFTTEPIEPPPLVLANREIGACVEFRGLVRELERGEALAGLFYEAYEPMARKQLERIFTELSALHPCHSAYFIHRLGWVPVGETSVYVRILSSHRGEALAVCGAAIDRMKEDVPIWKAVRGRQA